MNDFSKFVKLVGNVLDVVDDDNIEIIELRQHFEYLQSQDYFEYLNNFFSEDHSSRVQTTTEQTPIKRNTEFTVNDESRKSPIKFENGDKVLVAVEDVKNLMIISDDIDIDSESGATDIARLEFALGDETSESKDRSISLSSLSDQFLDSISDVHSSLHNLEKLLSSSADQKKNSTEPLYTLSSSTSTGVILQEYFFGLEGNCSVKELEKTVGAKWRGGSKHAMSKKFGRRKQLYLASDRAIESGRLTLGEIVDILEEARTFENGRVLSKKSISWLCCNLPCELLEFLTTSERKVHNRARDHVK